MNFLYCCYNTVSYRAFILFFINTFSVIYDWSQEFRDFIPKAINKLRVLTPIVNNRKSIDNDSKSNYELNGLKNVMKNKK